MVLDGSQRLKEHRERGLPEAPPRLIVTSHIEAVKHLVLAGHQARAAQHCVEQAPHLAKMTGYDLGKKTGIPYQKFIPFVAALRHPHQKKRRRFAKHVVNRLNSLAQRMREGHQPTLADIDYVLGDFKE